MLTGFPDFVARRMLDVILSEEPDTRVRLLIDSDNKKKARRAAESYELERLQFLEGDIAALDLGLSGSEYLELIANITDIYNLAGTWHIGADRAEVKNVNIGGTRNIIDAAYEMERLERLNHFSTAFVSGDRTGVIMEEELDEDQSFRNYFEETKYYAELEMRKAMDRLPISVFRPSLIVGDADTGEIGEMAGPYYLMNAIVQMPSSIPVLMPGKGEKPLNLVPVDYVCRAMHRISLQSGTTGKTFHLTDPNPLSARRVFELVAEKAGKQPPLGYVPYGFTKVLMKLPFVKQMTENPRQFIEDFNQLTIFNSMNTMDAIGGSILCPPFPTYVDSLVDYLRRR